MLSQFGSISLTWNLWAKQKINALQSIESNAKELQKEEAQG